MSAAPSRWESVPTDGLAVAGLVAIPAAGVVDAVAGTPLLQPLVAFVVLTFVPGGLALVLVERPPSRSLSWWLYALGTSLIFVMAVGLVINIVYPLVGVGEPLSPVPLLGTLGAGIVGLAAAVAWVDPPGRHLDLRSAAATAVALPAVPLALLLVPVWSILSVAVLNRTGQNLPLLAALVGVAGVVTAVAFDRVGDRWHPLALWALATALLYHKSLWTFHEFRGQGNIVAAWRLGRWSPLAPPVTDAATTSLLPNAMLYPTYAHLGGVDIFTELNVVNPLLVSAIPVGAYVTFRRYVDSRDALLGGTLLAVAHPFYFQFPTGGRAASPVLFLVLFTCAVTDPDLPPVVSNGLAVLFAAGLVVSHYGASYFVLFALLAALPVRGAYRYIAAGAGAAPVRGDGGDDGDETVQTGERGAGGASPTTSWLSVSFVGYYAVLTLAWYIYTFGGRKFDLLVTHVERTVRQLYVPQGGGTAGRLTQDYGAVSIQLSKLLYLIVAVLMAVGLAAVYFRRFRGDDVPFDDAFVAFASMLVATFGLSFVYSSSWGGGRPLMLTFSVAGIFSVVGARVIAGWATEAVGSLRVPGADGQGAARLAASGFAVILVCLLLLNTGALAATVLGGYAPSNVPVHGRLETTDNPHARTTVYDDADLRTNAWLIDHRDPSAEVFGDAVMADFLMRAKNNDWNRARLLAEVDPSAPFPVIGRYYRSDVTAEPQYVPPYVMLGGHNMKMDVWVLSNKDSIALERVRPSLADHDRVYASPYGAIYYREQSSDDE